MVCPKVYTINIFRTHYSCELIFSPLSTRVAMCIRITVRHHMMGIENPLDLKNDLKNSLPLISNKGLTLQCHKHRNTHQILECIYTCDCTEQSCITRDQILWQMVQNLLVSLYRDSLLCGRCSTHNFPQLHTAYVHPSSVCNSKLPRPRHGSLHWPPPQGITPAYPNPAPLMSRLVP